MTVRLRMEAALHVIDRLSRWVIVAAMTVMIAVVSAQVALRYGFAQSMDSAEELSRLCFVWATFLAIAHGVARYAHVGIDMLAVRFPPAVQGALQRGLSGLSLLLMLMVAWTSVVAARDTWDQLMPTLSLSSGWFYVAVAVGALHGALHLLKQALSPLSSTTAVPVTEPQEQLS